MAFDPGEVGENLVQTWASQTGIVANPVRRDKCGWDFHFQFRRDSREKVAVPLDLAPPELTCMVQVKTTIVGATSEDVTLANWQRMTKDPLPWFVIRVAVDANGEPVNAYLIHVDETWIERVLRRLRELSDGESGDLHRRTLSLTWNENNLLGRPFPSALRLRITEAVGNYNDYPIRKARTRETIGYDQYRYNFTIGVPLSLRKENLERCVDFAIGLVKTLPVRTMTISDNRFGLPRVIEERRDMEADMELSTLPSAGTTRLGFSKRGSTNRIAIDFDTYTPTFLFPDLPEEYIRVRFVSALTLIVVNPATEAIKISWNIPDDSPVALSDLAKACAMLRLSEQATPESEVIVEYEQKGDWIKIGRAESGPILQFPVRELALTMEHALFVANYFELDPKLHVVPADVHQQIKQLTVFHALLDQTLGERSVSIHIDTDENLLGKRTAIVLPLSARLGEYILAAVIIQEGAADWDTTNRKLTISNEKTRLLDKWVIPIDSWKEFDMSSKVEQFCDALQQGDDYDFVTSPDNI